MHVFTDASVLAFAAVIYLATETNSEIFSSLVTSKTRVAPLNDVSLPWLELLGALTGARLIKCVHEALTSVLYVNGIVCWSDSLVTLYWIKGLDKDYKQFVENRVSEIRETTEMLSETERMHPPPPPSGHFSEHVQTGTDAYVKTLF